MYGGQAMIHTSGALGAEVLAPAMAAGTQIGAFHPLVAFADTERAVAALHGATVAIEGDDQLAAMLADMAEAIGATPVRLAPGSKAAYHAAAVLAAGGFVALLDAIAELGRVAGLDEAGSLAIYGPLIEGTLGNARALGIRAALTGPMTRGDVGTLEAHLETLRAPRPGRARRCTSPPPGARSIWPRRVARWHRRSRRRCARCSTRPCKPGLNRYHSLPWITASRPSTRPARRPDFVRPSTRVRERRLGLRPSGSFQAPGARATVAARPGGRAARPASRQLARDPAGGRRGDRRSGRPRPPVTMEWARSGRPGTARRPGAASAPWPA